MKIFQKQNTNIGNIAITSMMTAIVVGLFAILNFIPLASLIIVLFFPFLSFLTAIFTKKAYYLCFVIASILLCFSFAFGNISNIIFYLIPSLANGFIIAELNKKKISIYTELILATILQTLLSILAIYVIKGLYEINLPDMIYKLFGLANFNYKTAITVPFIILISFIQSFFVITIVLIMSKKLLIENINFELNSKIYAGIAGFLGILSILFSLLKTTNFLPILTFIISLIFCGFCASKMNYKKWYEIAVLPLLVFINVLIYVGIYKYWNPPYQVTIFSITTIIYCIYFVVSRKFLNI